jgi:hypothetical protein
MKTLLRNGASITSTNTNGDALLHVAVRASDDSNDDDLKLLLEWGAPPDQRNKDGMTPLHVLSTTKNTIGKRNIAFLLLKAGASVDPKTTEGHTPLDLAIIHCEDRTSAATSSLIYTLLAYVAVPASYMQNELKWMFKAALAALAEGSAYPVVLEKFYNPEFYDDEEEQKSQTRIKYPLQLITRRPNKSN